jgi:hypothetical protein
VVLGLRAALFVSALGVSYAARDMLGSVVSLVGGVCGVCTSLLLPTLFVLVLTWRTRSHASRVALAALAAFVVLLVGTIIAGNMEDIIRRKGGRAVGAQLQGWLPGGWHDLAI